MKRLHVDFYSTFSNFAPNQISIAVLFLVYILVHDPGFDFFAQGPESATV